MMQHDNQQPQELTMYGYETKIVLQILRDAEKPLSCREIERRAANYSFEVRFKGETVKAGGHTITDSRDIIRALKKKGYPIKSEDRYTRFGKRYRVHWLEYNERVVRTNRQTTIFDIEGV